MKKFFKSIKLNLKPALTTMLMTFILMPAYSSATLDEFFSATGNLYTSVDGAGSNNAAGHSVDVDKPSAGATVRMAFLMASSTPGPQLTNGAVQIDGTPINWDECAGPVAGLFSCRADVTSLIKPIMDAAAVGITSFLMTESNTGRTDGEVLVVVFDDPTETNDQTIILMFGAQTTSGDNFAITFAQPIDPADPSAIADMGLGIGFGFQPASQFSQIDVNGTRMTTSAGGQDDGGGFNGGLITVGGLGDSNDNPVNPFQTDGAGPRTDDELYSILPFLSSTDTSVNVFTRNPSNNDIIFFAYLNLSTTAILGEGILLSPDTATNPVGTDHTVTARVVDDNGDPVENRDVTFNVLSGPNAGKNGTDTTDALGDAAFTYTDTAGPGTDLIQASFVNSAGDTMTSNVVEKIWEAVVITRCDVNADGFIDRNDIAAIFAARNTIAMPGDPRDADGDGIITVNDGRACVLQCTLPRCAPQPAP